MRQIHGDLARERDRGLAPRRSKKFRMLDAENLRNRTFDSRLEVPVPFVAARSCETAEKWPGAGRVAGALREVRNRTNAHETPIVIEPRAVSTCGPDYR
jgi:hypothetical protein